MKKSTILLILAFILLWNSGFIGAEFGLPYTGPYTLIFLRYLAVTILLILYLLIRKRLKWYTWKVVGINMLIGFLAHGVWLTCVLLALNTKVPAGIVALIVALQPLATGAFSSYVTKEKTNYYQWIGLIIGFIGVLVTVAFRIDLSRSGSIFGYIIPLLSVIAITIATLIQRKMDVNNKKEKLPIDQSLFYQSLATMLVLAIPAILVENLKTEWVSEFTWSMLWLVLAVSIGAYILMLKLIDRLNATKVASLFYLGPPVTMFMAWIAFGDNIKIMDIVGILIVFFGVYLTNRSSVGS
ncbi:DMT family transporter [Zunongwangia sp. SCSIO 43204]|uniref:DMT family transporter n=1 Tax=Zunongwangia sp. SCSIO 43204 TaxID=2779359 RepID=UPI001CA9470A|nr:DMT family transporter [Zunongwangia sp. SCSIO 43204]UAB85615.1 DMT family transporter [Zunongwangia sp. SCSIO 43204]